MAEPALALKGLAKSFGALKVTNGVDLVIAPGELHALIGPNGAGKTTLVHQISGTLQPDAGTILFDGLDVTRLSPQRRARAGLARTFQSTSTIASLSALEAVGLAERAHAPAGSLSHGEKRALEIAMALTLQPKLILLDEPLAGVGHEEGERLIALLNRLKGRFAMLLVEHDMSAVFALADRVTVLVYGGVIASGEPAAVRADPAVRQAYLGEEG